MHFHQKLFYPNLNVNYIRILKLCWDKTLSNEINKQLPMNFTQPRPGFNNVNYQVFTAYIEKLKFIRFPIRHLFLYEMPCTVQILNTSNSTLTLKGAFSNRGAVCFNTLPSIALDLIYSSFSGSQTKGSVHPKLVFV